jgi:hypothetical protein
MFTVAQEAHGVRLRVPLESVQVSARKRSGFHLKAFKFPLESDQDLRTLPRFLDPVLLTVSSAKETFENAKDTKSASTAAGAWNEGLRCCGGVRIGMHNSFGFWISGEAGALKEVAFRRARQRAPVLMLMPRFARRSRVGPIRGAFAIKRGR